MPALRTRDTQHQRSLEVTTDAPPPSLAIISPTPRAFTFASAHNLDDSPYSTPSHSPFEPDLHSLVISSPCTSTPPPRTHTPTLLSPTSTASPRSPSPSASAHKRRKSSTSCDAERRPKKGDDNYIKRPENAFILFRRKCCEERWPGPGEEGGATEKVKKQRQADLSKTISQRWKALPAEEKQYWEDLAKEKKKEHAEQYPDYVYRPQRAKDKDGRPKPRKSKAKRADLETTDSDQQLSFAVPVNVHRHGRSSSAPTPPLAHQIIQVPTVSLVPSPSCPASPSLVPMIARRTSHTGDLMSSHFQYANNQLMPFSFGQAGLFEASLQQSPDFYPSMFNNSCQPNMLPSLQTYSLNHTTLLPAHEIVSPCASIASGSSGPPSPHRGPFTPTHMSTHLFAPTQLELIDPLQYTAESQCSSSDSQSQTQLSDLELGMSDMDMQYQFHGYTWENNSIWQPGSESLDSADFNLELLPVAQFDDVKGNEEVTLTIEPADFSQDHGFQSGFYASGSQLSDTSLLQYDEMMASF